MGWLPALICEGRAVRELELGARDPVALLLRASDSALVARCRGFSFFFLSFNACPLDRNDIASWICPRLCGV